jgi:PAS domain S-box-containing protein
MWIQSFYFDRTKRWLDRVGMTLLAAGILLLLIVFEGHRTWAWPPLLLGFAFLITSKWLLRRLIEQDSPQAQRERLEPIIEAVPNSVVVVDSHGMIVAVNAHTEQWFGYARDELQGQAIELLVPERYRPQHLADRNGFMAAASHRAMGMGRELFACRKDGSEFPVEIGLSPMASTNNLLVLASIVDLTERKKSEKRFRLVVEAAPNAMVMVNAEGRIVLVNSRMETWFGYARAELLGQPVEILVPERYRDHHLQYRENFMAHAEVRSMGAGRELFGLRKDGSEFPIEIGLNPIQTEDGLLVLGSIIDISERKAVESRFREHAEQVALASRYKSEFLANMSHELRTPLNSILILSEQLRDNTRNTLLPKQVEYADIIHKSGEDLLNLINDILDLSRIEAGHMQVRLEKVIVAEFSDYLHHAFAPVAENKGLEIQCSVDGTVPVVVILDFQRVYQILKNLFSNAVKFTQPGGKILIRFSQDEKDQAPALIISVTDTGMGIPKDKQALIFQAFQQLDGSINRKYGGTGLGLAISRQLAGLLGGSLTLVSSPGLGSTFSLQLPLPDALEEDDASTPLPTIEQETVNPQARQHRVVIVEDDVNFANVVADCARENHFDCRTFQCGREALESIEQNPPDAMVIDILLPDMSGWQLLDSLKRRKLPTLIISCLEQPTTLKHVQPMEYLVKPVDKLKLEQAFTFLHAAIDRQQKSDDTAPEGTRTILLVDDDVRNVYAMSELLEEAGMRVCIARNGAEALEIVRQRPDIDLILMDMMMPVLDGYQATATLRHDMHFTRPILAVTASAMKGDREKCLAVGADDYLAKPVTSHDLLARIHKLLE